ncbi:RNA-binding S4 domain-containing protein [Hippea maritima]|uniref:RQC P-site tRNA stabilizing factor n=1 Tax=Hippea maritima (strain ATCC 700847 / DSM 10411 / MH2) TaxID=760142 RepID=F2LWP2_HIPMA|nr:RNA-binding S4 domain-containing protein [Hippea maritima]AEA33020.1 RNA-binding S4 domain protein [Hippea maritima DSM 10411]
MRLDQFLKETRIIKRRTLAKQMCDEGFVLINSKKAKASYEVKIGDIIDIYFKQKKIKYRIESIPQKGTRKNEASEYYTLLGEEYYE